MIKFKVKILSIFINIINIDTCLSNDTTLWDITPFPSGCYFVKIKKTNGMYFIKKVILF
jgi:hypothetical protein